MIDHAHRPRHQSEMPPILKNFPNIWNHRFSRETYANTLIDIAHPTSLLARFMQNPSPIHVTKADHLITYLRDRKWLSLVVDGNTGLSGGSIKVFEGSSDAFYNTEAELLAFTHAD